MKAKFKKFFLIVGILAMLIIISLILIAVPSAADQVATWTGSTASRVKTAALSVVLTSIGLLLISFGVGALAVPVVGVALIAVGVFVTAYALWSSGWFGSSTSKIVIDDKSKLQKVI